MKKYHSQKADKSIVSDYMPNYGSAGYSLSDKITRVRSGLSMVFLKGLCTRMGLSLQEMASLIHVSLRTLQRYDDKKVFGTDISSKLLMLHELYLHGEDVMGADAFRLWLRESVAAIGESTPLSIIDNPFGMQVVDDILGRIEYGVFA